MTNANVLNWSGPEFLTFIFVAGVLALLLGVSANAIVRALTPTEDATRGDADPYTLALAAEGVRGALTVAITVLTQQGLIRVVGRMAQRTEVPPPKTLTAFERRVLREVTISGSSPQQLLRDVSRSTELSELLDRGAKQGLLLDVNRRVLVRLVRWAPPILVMALGTTKLFLGLSRGRPVTVLFIVLALGVPALLVLAKLPLHFSTRSATSLLAALKERNAALEATAQTQGELLSPRDLALATVLFGSTLVFDPVRDARFFLTPPTPISSGGSGGSGSWWDGGSSSCSSSSCSSGSSCGGGGGCGGCSS